MKKRLAFLVAAATLGCSNGGTTDAGNDAAISPEVDAGPVLLVTTADSTPTPFVPGAAISLTVVIANADGTTTPLPAGTNVTWTTPPTVVAADPNDAGGAALPSLSPLAFFVTNPFRTDRSDYAGVLFVVQQGNTDNPNVTVTATVDGFGTTTTYVPIRAPLIGDPDAGAAAYVALKCSNCHGATGAGSPMNDAGTFTLQGGTYAFPAPPLNACAGNCAYGDGGGAATDPGWNGALFGLAAQASIDNSGVALRSPMPDLLGSSSAQQFADIYAFMRTQTQ
jgi:hypothetical protein